MKEVTTALKRRPWTYVWVGVGALGVGLWAGAYYPHHALLTGLLTFGVTCVIVWATIRNIKLVQAQMVQTQVNFEKQYLPRLTAFVLLDDETPPAFPLTIRILNTGNSPAAGMSLVHGAERFGYFPSTIAGLLQPGQYAEVWVSAGFVKDCREFVDARGSWDLYVKYTDIIDNRLYAEGLMMSFLLSRLHASKNPILPQGADVPAFKHFLEKEGGA